MMASAAAITLGGYELVRSPSNSLFASAYGKGQLPLVTTLVPVMVIAVAFFYARTLTALGPRRTLFVSTIGTAVLLILSGFALKYQLNSVLWFIYLFKEAYVVLLIEQYWSFINSSITQNEAKRINGLVCGIASVGSISAGIVGSQLAQTLGSDTMIILAGVVTLPAALIANAAFANFGEPEDERSAKNSGLHLAKDVGLSALLNEKVLLVIMSLVVLSQMVGTLLGLGFQGALYDAMPDAGSQSAYSYEFYAVINGVAALFQFILAPAALAIIGPRWLLIMVPLIHIIATGLCYLHPTLSTWAVAFAAFKCIDYSIFRAAKEALYVPLSFAARYRAKELIDVVGYRVSKGVTSGVVSLLQTGGVLMADGLLATGALVGVIVWLGTSFLLRSRSTETANQAT